MNGLRREDAADENVIVFATEDALCSGSPMKSSADPTFPSNALCVVQSH